MAYYYPFIKKCPVCHFEKPFDTYNQHMWGAPISMEGVPYCPKCFDDFIKQHIPQTECTGETYTGSLT